MTRNDPVQIVRGPFKGHTAVVIRKVCGQNDGWFCRSPEFPGMVMVYETEIRQGKEG